MPDNQVDAQAVVDHLAERLRQVEIENATLRALVRQCAGQSDGSGETDG